MSGIVDRMARWQIAGLDAWSIADDRHPISPEIADAVVARMDTLLKEAVSDG